MDYAGDSAVRTMNTGAEAFYRRGSRVTRKKRGRGERSAVMSEERETCDDGGRIKYAAASEEWPAARKCGERAVL
jgi:hypothetical protein